ncbi:hypothetical protein [Clostridium tagluense]|uniref:Uncharacterized protein n=1 Tax=Clostridium tagluense TaxID=360422 RepID=A0A401USV0_9CLOT|nr:hypothetical protein [Clostridium tagluense]GCD12617.1 hypothetical protein Ctaglu_42400 [Clostridium tagluense]
MKNRNYFFKLIEFLEGEISYSNDKANRNITTIGIDEKGTYYCYNGDKNNSISEAILKSEAVTKLYRNQKI